MALRADDTATNLALTESFKSLKPLDTALITDTTESTLALVALRADDTATNPALTESFKSLKPLDTALITDTTEGLTPPPLPPRVKGNPNKRVCAFVFSFSFGILFIVVSLHRSR